MGRKTEWRSDRDSPWLNRPRVGYCALCNEKVLYVSVGRRDGLPQAADSPGEILNIEPHPSGRWGVLPDGFHYHKNARVCDGHSVHRCGSGL